MGRLIKPYGATTSKGRYEEYITNTGWKYDRRGYCLHWISHGRHCRCYDNKDYYDWMDHTSGYTRETEWGKERMLMCQPYGLNHPETLMAAAEEFDLDYEISGRGWYGCGTVTIQLTPKGQNERESAWRMAETRRLADERRLAAAASSATTGLHAVLADWEDE